MSEEVEQKILGLVADGTTSPYGNPVPGLEELGHAAAPPASGRPSHELASEAGTERVPTRVVRLGEPVQVDPEVLGLLLESGVRPGADVIVWREAERTIVEAVGGEAVSLPVDVASHIFCA